MGWIKVDDNAVTKNIDDYFRTLPKETISVAPANNSPGAASQTSENGVSRIPILVRGSKVYVVVTFNKSVSKYLLLDTGAYQTVVSKRIATDLGLRASDRSASYGVGGSVTHDVSILDSIRVGGFEVRNFQVNIFDHTSTPNDEGLLGFDFLGLFHMSIDPEKQEMVLTRRKK
jgi:predicted aspartyl protease